MLLGDRGGSWLRAVLPLSLCLKFSPPHAVVAASSASPMAPLNTSSSEKPSLTIWLRETILSQLQFALQVSPF